MEQRIRYRKVREFGPVFSAAFGFLKQNFGSFYGSIFLIAGPFLLIGSTVAGVFITSLINENITSRFLYGRSLANDFLTAYFSSLIVFFIGYSVFIVVLNKNVIEGEKTEDGQRTRLGAVTSGLFMSYAWVLGQMILLTIVLVIVSFFLALFLGGFFAVLGPLLGGGFLIGMLVIFFTLAFYFILLPILSYIGISSVFVCQRDNLNIFSSIGKTLRYMKGNFWNTWLVGFVAFILYAVLLFLTILPFYFGLILSFFSRMKDMAMNGETEGVSSLYLVLFTSLVVLLGTFSVSVYYLLNIFHFGNLEERKEGSSMLDKINTIE